MIRRLSLLALAVSCLALVGSSALAFVAVDPVTLCNDTGGAWTDCGSGCGPFTCTNLPDPSAVCPAVCVPQCVCPEGQVFDYGIGCMNIEDCGGGAPKPPMEDADGDGQSPAAGDCDDNDETTYDGAEELCDGKDNDCDGELDEGCEPPEPTDADGDGYPEGEDCNDNNSESYPGAEELCDLEDNDCDGDVDEGCDEDPPIGPSDFQLLCEDTGGVYGCMETPCADEFDCPCVDDCVCPPGQNWDSEDGCVDSDVPVCEDGLEWNGAECAEPIPSPLELCESTGGEDYDAYPGCGPLNCEDALEAPVEGCDDGSFVAGCVCPEGQLFHAVKGCVDAAACEDVSEPVDPTDTSGGDDTGSSAGTSDAASGGGGGSGGGSDGCQLATTQPRGGLLLLLIALSSLFVRAIRRRRALQNVRVPAR